MDRVEHLLVTLLRLRDINEDAGTALDLGQYAAQCGQERLPPHVVGDPPHPDEALLGLCGGHLPHVLLPPLVPLPTTLEHAGSALNEPFRRRLEHGAMEARHGAQQDPMDREISRGAPFVARGVTRGEYVLHQHQARLGHAAKEVELLVQMPSIHLPVARRRRRHIPSEELGGDFLADVLLLSEMNSEHKRTENTSKWRE